MTARACRRCSATGDDKPRRDLVLKHEEPNKKKKKEKRQKSFLGGQKKVDNFVKMCTRRTFKVIFFFCGPPLRLTSRHSSVNRLFAINLKDTVCSIKPHLLPPSSRAGSQEVVLTDRRKPVAGFQGGLILCEPASSAALCTRR